MKVYSLLLNLLICVVFFHGKISFDLKVNTTSLKSTNNEKSTYPPTH